MGNVIVLSVAVAGMIVVVLLLVLLQRKSREISLLREELARASQERDEKRDAFDQLENSFEEEIDKVVQSSIQKIAEAENAKELAVQAAEDNYEVAAEAYAQLKEKDALIKKLQTS